MTTPVLALVRSLTEKQPCRQPWFKFFPADWQGDECLASCSLPARGLLIELVCVMHRATPYGYLLISGRQPSHQELARVVRAAGGAEVRKLLNELLERAVLSKTADGIVYSRRLVRYAQRSAANSENGTKGANSRWDQDAGKPAAGARSNAREYCRVDGDGNGERHGEGVGEDHHERYGEGDGPRSQRLEARSQEIPPTPQGFDEFWRAYPRKKAKVAAIRAWRKLKPDAALQQSILRAVEAQTANTDWQKDAGKYIPYPASWLNGGRWEDELVTASPIGERAEAFLTHYPAIYARVRSGARYVVSDADRVAAAHLADRYDDERLNAVAEVFLRRTDREALNTPGTLGQLRHMAPDCERLLLENGR
jgi:hypothetical protein